MKKTKHPQKEKLEKQKIQNHLKRRKVILKINQAKVQMKLQMIKKITNKIMIEVILK